MRVCVCVGGSKLGRDGQPYCTPPPPMPSTHQRAVPLAQQQVGGGEVPVHQRAVMQACDRAPNLAHESLCGWEADVRVCVGGGAG